jgi:hypothetical protein
MYEGKRRYWRESAVLNYERALEGLPSLEVELAKDRLLTAAQRESASAACPTCGSGRAPPGPGASPKLPNHENDWSRARVASRSGSGVCSSGEQEHSEPPRAARLSNLIGIPRRIRRHRRRDCHARSRASPLHRENARWRAAARTRSRHCEGAAMNISDPTKALAGEMLEVMIESGAFEKTIEGPGQPSYQAT